ncbi:BolA family transcriptional regulator [Parasedimentitalea marina]|uniref:BolA family transcriptional regulator n=1 Tax=Parasedimentitalea marina TaxID=2483033 RepID=A0A3T0N0I8_9RHOB|nr:BolA family protein [Parasedimentitalea marina]AZV77540.1 BolA family transcriptional regulator [Parasedimentitalea marina]
MSITQEIETRLQAAFAPSELQVINDSDSHRGHSGHDGSGESHFNLRIRAAGFAGKSRVQRHRMVHSALGDIVPRIHALAMDIDA